MRYVRYGDEWLGGLYAPYDLVVEIRDKIASYLSEELKLELSQDKTKITNLLKDKGQFLGFYFQIHKPKKSHFTLMRKGGHIRKSKISHNRMWLLIPVEKLLAKLSAEGFLKKTKNKNDTPGKKIKPSAKTSWIFLSHLDIVSRYNLLTKGLLNYYAIATNRYAFHTIINFILIHSCAQTLARKLNIRTRAKVFEKFGKDLTAVESHPQSTTTSGDNEIAKDKKGKAGISFYTLRKRPHYKRLLKWPETQPARG